MAQIQRKNITFLCTVHTMTMINDKTSCEHGDTICLCPLQVDNIFALILILFRHNNIFVFICQVAPVPACWLKTSAWGGGIINCISDTLI